MPHSYTRMTEGEWQQVLPLLGRIKPERLTAAHGHLVKGRTLAEAGEQFGLSRQNVHDVVQRVLEKRARLVEADTAAGEGIPRGWVRLTLDVPRKAAPYVQRFAVAVAHGIPIKEALVQHAPKSVGREPKRKRREKTRR